MQTPPDPTEPDLNKRFENLFSKQPAAFTPSWWDLNKATVNGLLIIAIALCFAWPHFSGAIAHMISGGTVVTGSVPPYTAPYEIPPRPQGTHAAGDNFLTQLIWSPYLILIMAIGFAVLARGQVGNVVSIFINLLMGILKTVVKVLMEIAPPLGGWVARLIGNAISKSAQNMATPPAAQPPPSSPPPEAPKPAVAPTGNPFLDGLANQSPPSPQPGAAPPSPNAPKDTPKDAHKFKKNPYDDPPDIDIVE